MKFAKFATLALAALILTSVASAQTTVLSGTDTGNSFNPTNGNGAFSSYPLGYLPPNGNCSNYSGTYPPSCFPSDPDSGQPVTIPYKFTAKTTLAGFTATPVTSGNNEGPALWKLFDNGTQFASCQWTDPHGFGVQAPCAASFNQTFNVGDVLTLEVFWDCVASGDSIGQCNNYQFVKGASWAFTTPAPPPSQQFWTWQSTTTTPFAATVTSGNYDGSTNLTNCTPATPCAQPLIVTFNTLNGVQAHLGGTSGGADLLTLTNDNASLDGGLLSLLIGDWCDGNQVFIVPFSEGGLQYGSQAFVVNEPCGTMPTTTLGGGRDAAGLTFTLTSFPNPTGTYTGSFVGASNSTINLTVNADFSVTSTATLAPHTLCAGQSTTLTLSSTDPLAINNGPAQGIAGYISGEFVAVMMADGLGNLTEMIGSATDANGSPLAAGQMFFTANTVGGVCNGANTYDAPFSLEGIKKPKGHGRHHHKGGDHDRR